MEFTNEYNMSIKDLIKECDAIFNTMSLLSSSSTTASSSSTTTTATSTTLSTTITIMTKEKLLSIHQIFKRNQTLMEELNTIQSSSEDDSIIVIPSSSTTTENENKVDVSIKADMIIEEIKSNLNEIVRMYQEFSHIVG